MAATADDATSGQPENPVTNLRDKIRARPGLSHAYVTIVFITGLLFILLGLALVVLPGPLTIPPVLVGLWIWSTEFGWAHRLFETFHVKARHAWDHAKANPLTSAGLTLGGLILAVAALWAVNHFDLLDRTKALVGL